LFQKQHSIEQTGRVDEMTASAINNYLRELGGLDETATTQFVVHGQVRYADGQPAARVTVRVYDKDLRSEELLGEMLTDAEGNYEIHYSPEQFKRAEKGNADLRVAACDADGHELKASEIYFNAAADITIDVSLPPSESGPSEYERYLAELEPVLQGVSLADIDGEKPEEKEKDIDFLTGDTGIARQHIVWLIQAAAFELKSKRINPAVHVAVTYRTVPAAAFYGWFREGLPDQWEQLVDLSIVALRTAARAAIAHGVIPAELDTIESNLDAIPNPQRDTLRAAMTIAGLSQEALGTVLQHAGTVTEVNNPLVSTLVEEGKIVAADAHRMGLGLAAHALVDGREAAMAAIVSAKPARLDGRGLQRARDLALLDVPDIEKALRDANVKPPAGLTPTSYSNQIARQIAEVFPTDVLLHRTTDVSGEVVSAIERAVASPARTGPASTGSRVGSDTQLRAFINLHPGLGLSKVVDEATDGAAAVSTIKERVGWIDRVHELNLDLDLFAIDYLPESESLKQVKFDRLPDNARSMVVANMKAYQRLQSVGAGALDCIELLKAGYRSSTALSRSRPSEIAEKTGLPIAKARAYHAQAERKANDAALIWFAFHDLERDARTIRHRALLDPPAYLKQLTGYAELFGSPDFCNCEHCQSVLGPAAYFVDLMFWVERHILGPSFKAHGGEKNALHLRSRRPKLWTLELTCDNTNRVVPTLDLVIDMLETFIVTEKRLASVAQLYEQLASADHSIRLPFSLPLERLSIWLSHLGISRSEIARTFLLRDSDTLARARIRLGMLPKQFQIITTSRLGDLSNVAIGAAEQFFSLWLNASLTFWKNPGETETRILDPLGVLLLARASGLDRAAISTVLDTDFVNGAAAGAPTRIRLEAGIATSGGVQNDTELVRNLTSGRLDRFERFVRLWRHVPWTVAELDYVVGRLQKSAAPNAAAQNRMDETMLVALAQLLDIQERAQMPVDELCALWDDVPSIALRSETSLFDRTFNLPPFVQQQLGWPDANQLINATPGIRARLVAALQINDQDLTLLTDGLDACLGRIDTDAQGNQTFVHGLWLNEPNLSFLYRYARLARLLKLSIKELLQTIALTPSIATKAANKRCISSLNELRAVFDVHGWRASSGFSVPEVLFITNAVSALAGYDSPDVLAASIAAEVAVEKSLYISLDLFTQIGLMQGESAKLIADNSQPVGGNSPLFQQVPGDEAYRIRRTVGIEDVAAALLFDPKPQATLVGEVGREVYRIVQRGGDAGVEPTDLVELGLSPTEAIALVDGNLSNVANDGKPFEQVPGSVSNYRLRAAVSEAAAIAAFGTNPQDLAATKSILRHRAVDLVLRHHAVTVLAAKAATAVKTSPEKTRALLNLAMPNTAAERQSLVDALQGGPLQILSKVIDRLIRYAVLFRNAVYDSQALEFVRANPAVLTVSDPTTAETVRRVSRYAALAVAPDPAYEPDAPKTDATALRSVLAQTDSIATATTDNTKLAQIAKALKSDVPQVKGVLAQIALADGNTVAARVDELSQLAGALALTHRLGVPPEILRLTLSDDPAQLARGAEGVFAAIRGKYPDEKTFHEKLEPFEDKLRSRNRDGLVEYLLSAPDDQTTDWRKRFIDANDLYHHFLTDVLVEGCARTSKVVAAISSVQLYVHRVLMNLEQSNENPPLVVARFDEAQRQEEWWWRKNYQVWVANRKVFLYPENYIEPGLRDDKTPLFKELEDTLLQQRISEQNVLDSYAQYLHGFEEVAQLRIAGAYHDRHYDDKQQPTSDLLHLFGVTASEPPVYYYRLIRDLENKAGPVFSAWEKIDLQIPVRKVSPIVYQGRLYVFWVETTTRQLNEFESGNSSFKGYRHSVRTKYSQLRLDGRWTPPQTLSVTDNAGITTESRVIEDARKDRVQGDPFFPGQYVPWDVHNRNHTDAIETYKPEGWKWEKIYLDVATPVGRSQEPQLRLMYFPRSNEQEPGMELADLLGAVSRPDPNIYTESYVRGFERIRNVASKQLVPSLTFFDNAAASGTASAQATRVWNETSPPASNPPIIDLPDETEVDIVAGGPGSAILHIGNELSFLQAIGNGLKYSYRRLGTSLAPRLAATATITGIPGLLSTVFQSSLSEADSRAKMLDESVTPLLDSDPTSKQNPFITYFREVFFQIPFLIADFLNSQQKFADAQRWYHYVYNPTANEPGVDEKKRPWRYREFREKEIWPLRKALTDPDALAAYRRDPFNPHAIARLRPGAYQKSIFMKYIDNLLDWGDNLFTQFTMESVNEATMLYVMAADILGPRPMELGPCGETSGSGKTYDGIAPLLRPTDPNAEPTADFLIEEFETFTLDMKGSKIDRQFIVYGLSERATKSQAMNVRSLAGMREDGSGFEVSGGPPEPAGWNKAGAQTWKEKTGTALGSLYSGDTIGDALVSPLGGEAMSKLPLSGDPIEPRDPSLSGIVQQLQGDKFSPLDAPKGFDRADYVPDLKYGLGDFHPSKQLPAERVPPQVKLSDLVRARLVFCIPENNELRSYWDRVEDRLNKIRNCMDIAGVRRRLELFAPEIDPRMLVRMRAAGLSLDDVMNVISGNLPPYRFTYLIEKAKQHAGVVQNFGGQVLSALEKRDGEELTRLRTVHEQNLLKLRSQMTQWEIDAAEDTLEGLRRQKTAVEYRRDHYNDLIEGGFRPSETLQVTAQGIATELTTVSSLYHAGAAIAHLVAQVGAPTSMKYGGKEIGDSLQNFGSIYSALASASDSQSRAAGAVASFERRAEDWKHQVELAKRELDQLEKQITAAEIRRDIATQSLAVHERSIDQAQEIFDFLRDRFTNFGRFTWLAAELQKLHRMAFNAALSMARLAEQACHFEHPDEIVKPGLTGDYWDAGNAGLLAGDRLMLDLHNLELSYIETHYRTLEIEQSFSLAQFDPEALGKLKTECDCTFEIPEWFFDLTYPGHYRRRIKGIRLTIPCVVGPYTNIGATLRLLQSWLRKDATMEDASKVEVPLRHVTAIAASTAQNDSGVFEFNFHDERYMPFEGAGAISRWQLTLPKNFPAFNYQTISDVILRISYTASEASALRDKVEKMNGTVAGTIRQQLTTTGIPQLFSLRHEFPSAWHRLVRSPLNTLIEFEWTKEHIPFFLSAFALKTSPVDVFLQVKLKDKASPTAVLEFDSSELSPPRGTPPSPSSWSREGKGLYKATTSEKALIGQHTLKMTSSGNLGGEGGSSSGTLDDSKLTDILLKINLRT
jgi:receptor-binding and translocation channel-forming TcA subunit of Tc toxin/ABC toxin-like protein/neuraminidase-like protein